MKKLKKNKKHNWQFGQQIELSISLKEKIINDAVANGFEWVVESDIEAFFPSINHKELFKLIDRYLPKKDVVTKNLLHLAIKKEFIKDGTVFKRSCGVAQGSPLSPLLANLFLDGFDKL